MLITGALVGLLGVPAGLYGNELSLRLGLRTTALGVFLASVMVNALCGIAAMLPYGLVIVLALTAGFIVQGNFSNLTSGLLTIAERSQRGTIVACTRALASPEGSSARCSLACLSIGSVGRHG
jgi:hypothetical protein